MNMAKIISGRNSTHERDFLIQINSDAKDNKIKNKRNRRQQVIAFILNIYVDKIF